jgi:hypothetical protein
MAKLTDQSNLIRMLAVGDSGSGKSGALVSLAVAGYRLHIADYDGGLEILRNMLVKAARDAKKPDTFYTDRVDAETCKDPYTMEGNLVIPKASIAWGKGIKYLQTAFNKNLGEDDIVVMDSLSFAARAAMIYVLSMNGRLKGTPYQSDWGEAQRHVERAVDMITGNAPCHVYCSAHIAWSGGKEIIKDKDGNVHTIDNGPEKGLPAMIGNAINGVIPRYFNHMLLFRQVGSGNAVQRKIHTTTFDKIELKNTNPGVIKPDYPLATGLAEYFKDARGTEPSSQQKAA